jgi:hypothetical protein
MGCGDTANMDLANYTGMPENGYFNEPERYPYYFNWKKTSIGSDEPVFK